MLKSIVMLVHSSVLNPVEQVVPFATTFIASMNWFLMLSLHDTGTALSFPSFVSFFTLGSIVNCSCTGTAESTIKSH